MTADEKFEGLCLLYGYVRAMADYPDLGNAMVRLTRAGFEDAFQHRELRGDVSELVVDLVTGGVKLPRHLTKGPDRVRGLILTPGKPLSEHLRDRLNRQSDTLVELALAAGQTKPKRRGRKESAERAAARELAWELHTRGEDEGCGRGRGAAGETELPDERGRGPKPLVRNAATAQERTLIRFSEMTCALHLEHLVTPCG